MEIRIAETNEIKDLDIIDPKSGVNWIADLMGNHGALPTSEVDDDGYDTGNKIMSQEDYEWWSDLVDRYQAADDRYHALRKSLDDDEALVFDAQNINVDLEDYPGALNDVCDQHDKA